MRWSSRVVAAIDLKLRTPANQHPTLDRALSFGYK